MRVSAGQKTPQCPPDIPARPCYQAQGFPGLAERLRASVSEHFFPCPCVGCSPLPGSVSAATKSVPLGPGELSTMQTNEGLL